MKRLRTREVRLRKLGCAFRPPPEFVFDGRDDVGASFHRVSSSLVDAADVLFVLGGHERLAWSDLDGMTRRTETIADLICAISNNNVRPATQTSRSVPGAAVVLATSETKSASGWRRAVALGFVDDDQLYWCIAIESTSGRRREELVAELDDAHRSWRKLS